MNPANLKIIDVLSKYKQGNTRDYDILVNQLTNPQVSRDFLLDVLKQLRDCTSLISRDFEVLVGVILRLDWLGEDAQLTTEYQALVVNLVSSGTYYLRAVLRMLLLHFTADEVPGETEVSAIKRKQDETQSQKLHTLLHALIKIVPMAPKLLIPLVSECFPFIHRSAYKHESYARNLLQMTTYMPVQRRVILEAIVDRMTKLDVVTPRKQLQEAAEDADIFVMEGVEKSPHSDVLANADRLDVLMHLMFTFIDDVCHKNGALDWEATKTLYREMLLIFDRLLLPTYASCHVQFVFFYLCSLKEALVEGFLDFLWKKVQCVNTEIIYRQTAVSYMASLLARANYIPLSIVRATLELMVRWIHSYLATASCVTPDPTHHATFYSVCQAAIYVFIFTHKQLLGDAKGEYKFCQSLNFQSIVTSRLNPLKFCLPIITKTFASITRIHQLAFCDTVLERNRRCLLPQHDSHTLNSNPLDSFFPFDPYLLNRSRVFIEHLYQEYEGSVEEEDEPQHKDEEMEDYGDDQLPTPDITQQMLSTTPTSPHLISPPNLLLYGSSPGFKHT